MSTAYYIVLDHPDPGFNSVVNGKFLAHNAPMLNRICQALGVKTFDEYVSQDPEEARSMIEECGGDPDEVEIPEERWFSIEEGITFVQQLSSYIGQHSNTIANTPEILSDLHEFVRVFEDAQKIQAKWHLGVDF